MQINLIGIGQCGSFIVYDVLADLFDAKSSKDLRATRATQWAQDVARIFSGSTEPVKKFLYNAQTYFTGQKVIEFPRFYELFNEIG